MSQTQATCPLGCQKQSRRHDSVEPIRAFAWGTTASGRRGGEGAVECSVRAASPSPLAEAGPALLARSPREDGLKFQKCTPVLYSGGRFWAQRDHLRPCDKAQQGQVKVWESDEPAWMEMARWHTSTEHMPQGGKDTLSFEIRHQNRADAQPPRGVFSRHRKFSERGRKGRTSRPVAWPRLPPRSFLHGEHRCFHSGSES